MESDVSTPLTLATRHMTINEIESESWESPRVNRGLTDAAGRKLSPGGLNRKVKDSESSGKSGSGGSEGGSGGAIGSELRAVQEGPSGEDSRGGKWTGGKHREKAGVDARRKDPGCGCVIM